MRAVIDDIAPEAQLKLYAETVQEYFDAWKDAAMSIREQHNMEWIETHQPAVYLLLSMLGKVLSAPMRFCSFSPNRICRKMAGNGVQPLHNYTCRFRPSSLKQAEKLYQ